MGERENEKHKKRDARRENDERSPPESTADGRHWKERSGGAEAEGRRGRGEETTTGNTHTTAKQQKMGGESERKKKKTKIATTTLLKVDLTRRRGGVSPQNRHVSDSSLLQLCNEPLFWMRRARAANVCSSL